jgi:tight adherence protein C
MMRAAAAEPTAAKRLLPFGLRLPRRATISGHAKLLARPAYQKLLAAEPVLRKLIPVLIFIFLVIVGLGIGGGVGAVIGYMFPYVTVRRKAHTRVMEMRETLPDSLDLIVVCVEAGMGIDAALNRVGKEQFEQGLAIGEELMLTTQEMQAGAIRKEALLRLADRIGIDEFRALITFLTQTEELGGSIARSLRVYAGTMREKRSQSAEEAARKAVIKLIFPLVFFILPAIFIIILGPAFLSIMKLLQTPLG